MIILFDVLGTLFSLDRVRKTFLEKKLDPGLMDLWFSQVLQAAMATTLAGQYTQLKVLAHAGLKQVFAFAGISEEHFGEVYGSLRDIEPSPHAVDCVHALRSDGHRLVALTNNTIEDTNHLLEVWGIRSSFEAVYSADQVKACKPSSLLYEMVMRSIGCLAFDCCLVSAHSWDVLGAASVGMNTAYLTFLEKRWRFPERTHGFVLSGFHEVRGAIADKFGTPARKAA